MKTKQKHYHPLIGIVVLLLIALLVAWYIRRPDPSTGVEDSSVVNHDAALETNNNGETVPKTKNSLTVTSQKAGTSIDIDYFSLQKPGYVVIHSVDKGVPGKIVAHSGLLSAGAKQDLIIRYTTTPGLNYVAMLHNDDGDKVFDATKDLPLVGSDSQPIMAMFSVVK